MSDTQALELHKCPNCGEIELIVSIFGEVCRKCHWSDKDG